MSKKLRIKDLSEILDIQDTRTHDDLIGRPQLKKKSIDERAILIRDGKPAKLPSKLELNAIEKSIKTAHKRRGLDLLDEALSVTYDLMTNSLDEKVRFAAARDIQDRFGGRAGNMQGDAPVTHAIPIFNINMGAAIPTRIIDGSTMEFDDE